MRKVNVVCVKDHKGDNGNGPGLKKDEKYSVLTDDRGFINFFNKDNVSELVMFGWKLDEIKDIVITLESNYIKSFKDFKN